MKTPTIRLVELYKNPGMPFILSTSIKLPPNSRLVGNDELRNETLVLHYLVLPLGLYLTDIPVGGPVPAW